MEQNQTAQAPVASQAPVQTQTVDEPVAEAPADGRTFDTGDVQELGGVQHEVTAVSYNETPEGVRHNFQYTFKDKAELDAEREEEARLEAERKQNEANALAAAQDQLEAEGVQAPPVA